MSILNFLLKQQMYK